MPTTFFVSGHLDLTPREFNEHYVPLLAQAMVDGADFVVGDARGADAMTQAWLAEHEGKVRVFHMKVSPRNNIGGFPLQGGFESDAQRDEAMTLASTGDIAWVRPSKRDYKTGTYKNLQRRLDVARDRDRAARAGFDRFVVTESEAYPVYHLREARSDDEPTVPIPDRLRERLERVTAEWNAVQSEIRDWKIRQEIDPV